VVGGGAWGEMWRFLRLVGCVGCASRDGRRRRACIFGEQAGGFDGIEPVADIMWRVILVGVVWSRDPYAAVGPNSAPVLLD
jgi:hypothetical protein